MKLQYRAKDKKGNASTGEIDATSLAEARQRLRAQGLFVLEIETGTKAKSSKKKAGVKGRVSKVDLVMAMSQLTIICQSGEDLAEALKAVAHQCPKPALQYVLNTVYQDVNAGISMSDAMRKHPHVFDQSFVAGIAAGEQSGTITLVLERLTNLIRADMKLRSTIWSMLMYPIVLCGVTMIVLNVMVFFVLPQFAKVFADMDKPTPPLTEFLLSFGDFAVNNFAYIVAGIVLSIFCFTRIRRTTTFKKIKDHAWLNLAVVKNSTRALLTGRAFRLLGTMLQSGVPLIDGIRLCRAASGNSLFQKLFDDVENSVLNGEGMGKTLLAAPFLPQGAANMVVTAERTGKLGPVLQTVGEYYEDEGERYLRDVVKIMEPLIIVFLGVIVAGVVISVILPLLDVSTMTS